MSNMDEPQQNCMDVMRPPPQPMVACYVLPALPLALGYAIAPSPGLHVIFHEATAPQTPKWFHIPLTFRQFPCLAINVVATKTLHKLRVETTKPLFTKTWIAKIAHIHWVPFTTNWFLCIKITDSQVSKFRYNDYPFITSRCDQWQDKYWQFINNPNIYSPNLTK